MLGKLIKYEFKASSRLFLLLYGALLLLSIINCILIYANAGINSENPVLGLLQGVMMFGYVVLIIAIVFTTLVVIIMRFYKNLLGDEGYLMFTLPVSTSSQILSKLITSVVWGILSLTVVVASIFIVTAKFDGFGKTQIFFEQAEQVGFNIPLWITGIVISVLVYMICLILMFYAAMAIGPNLTKNRLLGSFLAYIILYIVSQVFGVACVGIMFTTGFMEKLLEYDDGVVETLAEQLEMFNLIGSNLFFYILAINVVLTAVYYGLTRYFIKNKLNLS